MNSTDHICTLCNKSFGRSTHLKRHKKTCGAASKMVDYACKTCSKTFTRKDSLQRHKKSCNQDSVTTGNEETALHQCRTCRKAFLRKDHLLKHEKICMFSHIKYSCTLCDKPFSRDDNRKRHEKECTGVKISAGYPCTICNSLFKTQATLSSHLMRCQIPRKRKSSMDDDARPTKRYKGSLGVSQQESSVLLKLQKEDIIPTDNDIADVYQDNWQAIRTHWHLGKVQDWYNITLDSLEITSEGRVAQALREVYQRTPCRFKISHSYGYILRNIESNELRYYHPCVNNSSVMNPRLITNQEDMENFLNDIKQKDILKWAQMQRPNTKTVVDIVTSVLVVIDKLPNKPIGSAEFLPAYIINNAGLNALYKDKHNGYIYTDNKCLFRCLALADGKNLHHFNRNVNDMYKTFCTAMETTYSEGITLTDLIDVENVFKLNINVYELSEDGIATLVQRSRNMFDVTMYVNLHETHFSYINSLDKYSHCFACRSCGKHFDARWETARHEITCTEDTKYKYPGGIYKPAPSVFAQLAEENIHVPKGLQFYDYRSVYDIETLLDSNITELNDTATTEWKQKHVLLSVSVCSNVPGFTKPKCFVSQGSALSVVKSMIDYLHEISEEACNLMTRKLNPYIQELDSRIQNVGDNEEAKFETKKLETLRNRLDNYLNRLPVIGFNSGNYDLNVLKPHLVSYLQEIDSIHSPIKRNNHWMSISTERLQFLDICNYLAPGYSYEKYLKAYGASLQKSFFPYDWMDSLEKLNYSELPPKTAFYNKLKNKDISDDDYETCKTVWREYNMRNMKDWLVYYNNLDVEPFIEALENQFQFYKARGLDMFKDGISVPGLTNKYLFDSIPDGSFFSLMGENHKDLYESIRNNLVGGPSIVFHRYQWKDETYLRTQSPDIESKPCKGIAGYDANALYLWALSQLMPTGWYIRRREENAFKLEDTFKQSKQATEWLKWIQYKQGLDLVTAINNREKRLGKRRIPVDGWDPLTNTAYNYHGCYYHGCQCSLTKTAEEKNPDLQKERRDRTEEIHNYLISLGITLVEIKECQWLFAKSNNNELKEFVQSLNIPEHPVYMSQETIKNKIQDGSLFGLIECDIHVPDTLKEYFSEMTPIFKHAAISKEDLSPLMKQYADDNGLMNTPTKSLIGSYTGEKIMLATPLLQWYIEHGLVITKIYQTVEFQPHPCFKTFADAVSDARRAGDVNTMLVIIAETMKLLGNSAYGKTITDKERHMNIHFTNEDQVTDLINESRFRSLNVIKAEEIPDLYEVKMRKKSHSMDLPVHIGFFVYSYAKLKMLQFYYDLVDKFVDRSNFEYCQMDTDSAYIALAGRSLDDLVRPELRQQYFAEYNQWFLTEACDKHMPLCNRAQLAGIQWPAYRGCAECVKTYNYTKRTPGLFKLEYYGDGIVCLCSKTYFTSNLFEEYSDDVRRGLGYGSVKTATKALNKTQNRMTKEKFLQVLASKTAGSGTNRGFRVMKNCIYTYTQQRSALSYMYGKRLVMDDGVSTKPLLL